jgi:UDP-glucose 4-epimerase
MTSRVLVTNGAGALGRLLCRRLHRTCDVLSIDMRPFPDRPKDVEHHEVDLRRKAAQQLIKKKKPDVVIAISSLHEANARARRNNILETASALLESVEHVGATKFIYVSSSLLYGPSPTSAAFLTEDAPLLGARSIRRFADPIAVDMMLQGFFWKRPQTETVILRPVHIVGPSVDTAAKRYLTSPRPITMLGFDPMMQLVHEDDFADAVTLALQPGVRGVFNIVGQTQAPLSRLHDKRDVAPTSVPGPLLQMALSRMRRLGMTEQSEDDLVHLKYSCLVDGSRAQDGLKYMAQRTLMSILQSV